VTPALTPAVARAVLAAFRPDYPVSDVVTRTGGEVHAVYEIRGTGSVRPLIVKVYDPRRRSKLVKEVYVYRLLARHGVRQIPRVLHASPFGIPALPFAHTVMTRLDGRPLAEVRDDVTGADLVRVYRQMGGLLAAVHAIPQDHWGYVTTRVVDVRPSNTAYVVDQFARRLARFGELGGDPAVARAVEAHVARHVGLFAACAAPVLCHNDFHDGNVLVSRSGAGSAQDAREWRVTGFVDVEGAVAADPLFDLARTDYHALRGDPATRAAFLGGYSPLPPDWADRVAVYRLHHALELWNWAATTADPTRGSRAMTELETVLLEV
jgi:hygromycin-B 7''-O-kinase